MQAETLLLCLNESCGLSWSGKSIKKGVGAYVKLSAPARCQAQPRRYLVKGQPWPVRVQPCPRRRTALEGQTMIMLRLKRYWHCHVLAQSPGGQSSSHHLTQRTQQTQRSDIWFCRTALAALVASQASRLISPDGKKSQGATGFPSKHQQPAQGNTV